MKNQMSPQQKKNIIFRLFAFDPAITGFVFESVDSPHLRERPEVIIENSWDLQSEDRVLVRAALDIWSASGHTYLSDLIELSEPKFNRLLEAVKQARTFRQRL